ncbi:response regulator [Paenibacillus yanchengensis]|uniref:Response regulator n=1 Tax=Paenibacillus yanchengensis TaxID=2035833 RepID=A0ABW4YPH4_9BACL
MFKTIIVDDEAIIRQGIKQIIDWEQLGFTIVEEAANGSEALDKMQSQYFHLMITDITMPKMDGISLIKKAREKFEDLKIIVLSGYNDFQYVKEAMKYNVDNYLLKPVEQQELSATLDTIKQSITTNIENQYMGSENTLILTNHLLNRLVKGNISMIEFRNRANFLQLSLPTAPYYLALIEMEGLSIHYEAGLSNNDTTTFFACINVMEELLSSKKMQSIIFEDEMHRLACLFHCHSSEVAAALVNDILHSVQIYVKEKVTIALSEQFHSINTMQQHYVSTNKLLDYRFFTGSNVVITAQSIPTSTDITINEDLLLANYERVIRSCHKQQATEMITNLYDELMTKSTPTRSFVEYITLKLVVKNVEVIKEYNGNASFLQEDTVSLSQQMVTLPTIELITNYMLDITNYTIDTITHLQKNRPTKIIEHVCEYIEKHYAEDMTLKGLGDLYYINPSYLGKLFRKDKGEPFNDHLNKVRLQQAKQLIQTSNLRIYQIAERVGYKDYNYFSKMFKQHFGVLPRDFK